MSLQSEINRLNNTVATQADLLSQIQTALEGKTAGGGIDTSDATATARDILAPKTAYVNGEKITGTIASKTSSDLSASGDTVTVPAGYYTTQATKSVSAATQATPTISLTTDGLITATSTQTAGYVSAGTKSATYRLSTQAAKTITPSTTSQTAVDRCVYTTGVVTVAPIPSNYEDVATETSAYTTKLASLETAIAALETELEGKASGESGANFETSIVTLNVPVQCKYLGTDFQPKDETTSTFETIKNSIVYIGGQTITGSGYTVILANNHRLEAVQLTETIVNIIIATSSGAD